jgi:hypothetical protein
MARRERRSPSPAQVKEAGKRLAAVPWTKNFTWTSAEGRRFLAYVEKTIEAGVPLTWLADELDLGDAGQTSLYMALRRYRAAKEHNQ